ncbi:MAG: 2TM domain-containing protein [Tenacibaculum sp.]
MDKQSSDSIKKLKRSLWISLLLTLLFGTIFNLVNQNFSYKAIGFTYLFSAIYSFILSLGNFAINHYLSQQWSWTTQFNKRLSRGIIATILYNTIAVLLIHYLIYAVILGFDYNDLFLKKFIWIHLFAIVLALGVSAFLHARGFIFAWKEEVSKENTQQKLVAKTETAKFETLKNQIDPHFLFNSLNVLTSLISENPVKAEKFTIKLSAIYRYVLEQKNKELVLIEDELNFAKTYMELLQMRFEDAIQFSIPAKLKNKTLKVIPLSLQLLLENAVKHNIALPNKPLKINIFEEQDYLHIQNYINPKEIVKKSTKIGLKNIAERYALISDKSLKITKENTIFTVSLPLLTKAKSMITNTQNTKDKYIKAVEKVERLKEFYQNLFSFCIVIPVLIFINLKTYSRFQWFWFPMIFWGIGLIFHYLDVKNYNLFLGKKWEERKIKELMDKHKLN